MSQIVVKKMLKDNKKATFGLQLTAMVDMFTIMLVFLLKSQSSSSVNIVSHEDLKLPISSSFTQPQEALRITVTRGAIFIDDKKIIELSHSTVPLHFLDSSDEMFIPLIFSELKKHEEKTRNIASKNEELKFEGKIIMHADQDLPYGLLRKIMYTSSAAGYTDLKLATILTE